MIARILTVVLLSQAATAWANELTPTPLSLAAAFQEPAGAELAIDGAATGSLADASCCGPATRWYLGADYRLMRTHFSEAVAFATLTVGAGPEGPDMRVVATELDFDYESAFGFYVGYRLNERADLRFSYWNLDSETGASAAPGAGQWIVDPFGNIAPAGAEIDAVASVDLNVFDFEYVRRVEDDCGYASWSCSAGLRMADVDQFYESTVSLGGGVLSNGVFAADFFGVGPYASFTGHAWAGRPWSAFAKVGGALLVGDYNVSSDLVFPGVATGGQLADRIRTVPVLESELGISWQPGPRFRLSAGWLFQAWMNIGVSGGTFDGENLPLFGGPPGIDTVFGGADDADIMSFDGLFVRGEFGF